MNKQNDATLLRALCRLKVETGSLACLGCGHEHSCSTRGCAIINQAMDAIRQQEALAAELLACRAQLQALEKAMGTGQLVRAPQANLADVCPAVAGGGA